MRTLLHESWKNVIVCCNKMFLASIICVLWLWRVSDYVLLFLPQFRARYVEKRDCAMLWNVVCIFQLRFIIVKGVRLCFFRVENEKLYHAIREHQFWIHHFCFIILDGGWLFVFKCCSAQPFRHAAIEHVTVQYFVSYFCIYCSPSRKLLSNTVLL